MDELQLLLDLHKDGTRQGPGGDDETRLAIALSGLRGQSGLRIADIGCGTGASTLVLAEDLDAQITAVDFLGGFLERLRANAEAKGLSERITTLEQSMEALPFEDGSLDAIWSEGAIYNIGFEEGVRSWRRFLKPGGILAASEITWLSATRPQELQGPLGCGVSRDRYSLRQNGGAGATRIHANRLFSAGGALLARQLLSPDAAAL